jgi:phage terminase large subunit-like protein
MVEGPSGILANTPKAFRPLYEPSKRRLTWPNGASAGLYNATEPDQLRGPQFEFAWLDELAKWRYMQETWDQLQFGMRLGDDPKQLITTTPRPLPLIREILKYSYTHVTRGSTYDNEANLARSFFNQVVSKYEGTRLGRQEIDAEILDDVPGAMFSRDDIERTRLKILPDLSRIVVSVDPSGTAGSEAQDDVGIVVAARTHDRHGVVIDDRTCNAPPSIWAKRAVDAYHEYSADCIIAESNFGGAMVENTIRSVPGGRDVPIKLIHASRGKHIRAQPIASLYEQHKIHHLGQFSVLEDELCFFTHDGYMGVGSPNRADAAIWAFTELLISPLRKATSAEM